MSPLGVYLLLILSATWSPSGGAVPFLWGCDNFLGYCRLACFARESSVGQKECAEGMICCVPSGLGDFW